MNPGLFCTVLQWNMNLKIQDLDIFIRILNLRALDFAFKNENFNYKVYEIINNFYRDYKVKTYDKKWLVENLLTKLKVTKTLL